MDELSCSKVVTEPAELLTSTFGPFAFSSDWSTMLENVRNAALREDIKICRT
jgi:hypothetical protein